MSDIYITWDEYNKKIEELAVKIYSDGCKFNHCLLYTSPSPRDLSTARMPSSA